jgi:hypothetical protein
MALLPLAGIDIRTTKLGAELAQLSLLAASGNDFGGVKA